MQSLGKSKAKRSRNESQSTENESSEGSEGEDSEGPDMMEEEDDWTKFQEEAKKENTLETKSKETHLVHCPFFPAVSIAA